jgi:signal transduction histidine kinase
MQCYSWGCRTGAKDWSEIMELSLPRDRVLIQADGDALRRALLVLMDNAVKYTPEGGSIRVKLGKNNGFAIALVSEKDRNCEAVSRAHLGSIPGREGSFTRTRRGRTRSVHSEMDR